MAESEITFRVVGQCFCKGNVIESRGKDVIRFCARCSKDFKVPG